MVIAFIAFGVLFGASAAVFTLVSGGSILLALAAYSGAGAIGAVAGIFMLLVFGPKGENGRGWQDEREIGPISA